MATQSYVRKARIGVIGTGWWATYTHLPVLAERPDVELVALADRDERKVRLAAEAFHVANTYTDYAEMVDKERMDGVVIAASHSVHYEIASAALEHSCHLLIEKPMVLKAQEARGLIELAQRQGKAIVMSYPWLYTPHVRRAREVISSGDLGEIEMISSSFCSSAYETYRGDRETLDKLFSKGGIVEAPLLKPSADANSDPNRGGGQGHCQVTHSAALAFWVTGLCARQVSAYMSCLDVAVDVVDAISMRMSNGAVGVVSSTGHLRPGDPGQHTLGVYGSHGHLILDMIGGTLLIQKHDGTRESPSPLPAEERYPRFAPANNFVDVILHNAENMAPGEVGGLAVYLLGAAYQSAAVGGMPVDVEGR